MQVIRGSEQDYIAASHEDPRSPGVLKRVLATHETFLQGRVQMLNWARLPRGSAFRAHYHEDMQEIFVIVSGQVRMCVDNQDADLAPGDAIVIEPREVHEMRNTGEGDAEYIVFGITLGQNGRTIVV